MKKKALLILAIIIVTIFSVVMYQGTISLGQKSEVSTLKEEEPNTIIIKDYKFQPVTLKVKKGTKVTWMNQDQAKHTITADNLTGNSPNSDIFGQGESSSFTFNDPGRYEYHCEPHPYMKGIIEVVD